MDGDLIEAADGAVARGHADSVSARVNDALRLKVDHDRKLAALAAFVKAYEAEHGEITNEDMRMAARRTQARATTVRGVRPERSSGRRRPRGNA